MSASQETPRTRRFVPRFSISFLLWGVTFYGLGIATQWWLEGHRSPAHYDARVYRLQQIVSLQDEYIRRMYSRGGMQDIRKLHLDLLVAHKSLDIVESRMGLESNAKTPSGMNYAE